MFFGTKSCRIGGPEIIMVRIGDACLST